MVSVGPAEPVFPLSLGDKSCGLWCQDQQMLWWFMPCLSQSPCSVFAGYEYSLTVLEADNKKCSRLLEPPWCLRGLQIFHAKWGGRLWAVAMLDFLPCLMTVGLVVHYEGLQHFYGALISMCGSEVEVLPTHQIQGITTSVVVFQLQVHVMTVINVITVDILYPNRYEQQRQYCDIWWPNCKH